jgi:hypothetical protein
MAMWMNAAYHGNIIDNWRSVKEHFIVRHKGKMETTTFCHQIPKLVQDKTETVSDRNARIHGFHSSFS